MNDVSMTQDESCNFFDRTPKEGFDAVNLTVADLVQGGDPTPQTLLELGGLERREDHVEPIVRRNPSAHVQKLRQPRLLGVSPRGEGHEVVRSTDHRTHRNRHHVDQRIKPLSPSGGVKGHSNFAHRHFRN